MERVRRDDAIINLTRITVRPENRKELCQTISSLLEPFQREKGCLACHFYQEDGDENTFVLVGEWETTRAWREHLKSETFAILLGSINLLCNNTRTDFNLLSHAAFIEAMTRDRISAAHGAAPTA
jgi:quinol monooxygenase YgiN